MASRRKTILDALVAKLNTITIANGYQTNLGIEGGAATPRSPASSVEKLPVAEVSSPEEQKSEPTVTYYGNELFVEVGVIAAEDGVAGLEESVDAVVSDVERAILQANEQDPPLLVDGVVDIVLLGHEKRPVGDNLIGAIVNARIRYRHSLTDPSVFP